jgi:hypothetical protein
MEVRRALGAWWNDRDGTAIDSVLAALREPVALSDEDRDGCITDAVCVAAGITHRRDNAWVGASIVDELWVRGFAIVRVSK